MKWQVFFDPAAEKQFSKLGRPAQQDIEKYIAKHLESKEDPRRFGKPYLSIKSAWRYRIGDYRMVCLIQEQRLVVLVLKVGHRRSIYD
ncbi:MAG: type II toxin-antitoxin system RelE/ParE family toxin [Methylacidiphilales bacterium]|nr:type II toxin-antitoxin system RelE/ParE family toxin [Candidatus Methylacidiphilales bacterium]